jgi:hypothetical protein
MSIGYARPLVALAAGALASSPPGYQRMFRVCRVGGQLMPARIHEIPGCVCRDSGAKKVARGASAFCEHPWLSMLSRSCRVSGTGSSNDDASHKPPKHVRVASIGAKNDLSSNLKTPPEPCSPPRDRSTPPRDAFNPRRDAPNPRRHQSHTSPRPLPASARARHSSQRGLEPRFREAQEPGEEAEEPLGEVAGFSRRAQDDSRRA